MSESQQSDGPRRVTPEKVGLSTRRLSRVSDWMQRQVDAERLAGLSVAVSRRGATAFFDTAGMMDVEAGRTVAWDTIYRIFSMTKPVTSVAAMMLYEEGRFQLDDPLERYLPEFADMQVMVRGDDSEPVLEPARTRITIRQLMTHTSGLTYWFMHATPVDALYRESGVDFIRGAGDLAGMTRTVASLPLQFHPGTRWNYSVSTDVLGRLVEVISGQSLDRFFAERIFEPLGMTDTGFSVPADHLDRLSAMYQPTHGGGLAGLGSDATNREARQEGGYQLMDPPSRSPFVGPVRLFSGGGGLVSTTPDYLRFTRMLLNRGELDGVRLLGRKTVEFMTLNHLPGDLADMGQSSFSETTMEGIGFGLGFSVTLDPTRAQIIGSPGEYAWGGAASTAFWVDPAEHMIVILMTQLMPSSTYPLRRELRALTYQAIIE